MQKDSAALTPAQQRVLGVLAAAEAPLTLTEVADLTGLHRNTLRGHLDALLAAERVTRVPRPTGRRGRPAWAYLARVPEYVALAHTLAEALEQAADETTPGAAAVRGGRGWGSRVRSQMAGQQPDTDDPEAPEDDEAARARLLLALEHTGFAPELDGDVIRLTQCPLLDAARAHRDVVCGAHLGLIEGVLGTTEGVALSPFAEPGACHVVLSR